MGERYALGGEFRRFATEKDDTFRVRSPDGRACVLKIANPAEALDEVTFQLELLQHIQRVAPTLPVPRVLLDRSGKTHSYVTVHDGSERIVRALSYLEGTPLDTVSSTAAQRRRIGEMLARLRLATASFQHPGESRALAWDVQHLLQLAPLLQGVDIPVQRQLLQDGLERFAAATGSLPTLRRQVLHNDFSRSNVVVDGNDPAFVTGIIDFGDAVRTAVAVDVSTALLNQLPRMPDQDPLAAARDLLEGYLSVADLTDEELGLIPHLVMGRVIARALLTIWRARIFPENAEYILRNTDQGWWQLQWFLNQSIDQVGTSLLATAGLQNASQKGNDIMSDAASRTRGKMVNGFDPSRAESLPPHTRSMIERRAKLLGPAYRLFYENPVEVSRGKGVFLYDRDGNEYLDAYNNVVSVGHSHPRVIEAVTRQMEVLCTHTRYLQEGILNYAEDLLPTFGGRIQHLMMTCTGSEANDLALRIAKHRTGKNGIIVTSEAYHGNSELTAGFSPSMGENARLGVWVRRVDAPDSYRHDAATLGERMARQVAREIDDLERRGDGVAAFIADSLFSSDGIYADPVTLLAPVAEVVRKAGGLFIADEVQSGFGRSGTKLWGYQRHGIDPDIVTMGKPMGNGFPVAGIAVAPDVVDEFGHDMRYFNTFGGNSVAVAAAQATLNVIRDEGLLANAQQVGQRLLDGIRSMASRYDFIGDVRGTGLYIAVEFVKDRSSKAHDKETALAVVNGLRERRVLISATGAHSNNLKIRPPLVFSNDNADRFLTELDGTLRLVRS